MVSLDRTHFTDVPPLGTALGGTPRNPRRVVDPTGGDRPPEPQEQQYLPAPGELGGIRHAGIMDTVFILTLICFLATLAVLLRIWRG